MTDRTSIGFARSVGWPGIFRAIALFLSAESVMSTMGDTLRETASLLSKLELYVRVRLTTANAIAWRWMRRRWMIG